MPRNYDRHSLKEEVVYLFYSVTVTLFLFAPNKSNNNRKTIDEGKDVGSVVPSRFTIGFDSEGQTSGCADVCQRLFVFSGF